MRLAVQTCCGCCDLRTGTIILGICGVLFSIGGIITHSAALDGIEDETTRERIKVAIGYSYLYIVVDGLLIYGAIKESRYFLLPWLVYTGIGLGILSAFSFILMFFAPQLILLTLLCGGVWYIWICVLSYYNQINPTNPPPTEVYSGATQISTMAPTVVTYAPQPPAYAEVGKGPQVV